LPASSAFNFRHSTKFAAGVRRGGIRIIVLCDSVDGSPFLQSQIEEFEEAHGLAQGR
jgi:hypothetical protein